MNNSKYTKRALLVSLVSMVLCLSMFVGSTYAWFTDSVVSGNNKIVAGNLDVKLSHNNGYMTSDEEVKSTTKLFVDEEGKEILWEPGVVAYENFTVQNVGNLALKYEFKINKGEFNTVNGKSLEDVLKVAILDEHYTGTREDAKKLTYSNKIGDFKKADLLSPKKSKKYSMIIYWDPSNSNNDFNLAPGKTADDGKDKLFVDLGVIFSAIQFQAEKDSFDVKYDVNLPYPLFDERDINNALLKDKHIILGNDVIFTAQDLSANSNKSQFDMRREIILDLAGHSITFEDLTGQVDPSVTIKPAPLNVGGQFGNMVIKGNGVIDASNRGYCVTVNGPTKDGKAKLEINGGTFKGKGTVILAGTNGEVKITGGFFQCTPDENGSYENLLMYGAYSRDNSIVVTGGTFVNFNPNGNTARTDFVPDGYKVVEETKDTGDIWYSVVPE